MPCIPSLPAVATSAPCPCHAARPLISSIALCPPSSLLPLIYPPPFRPLQLPCRLRATFSHQDFVRIRTRNTAQVMLSCTAGCALGRKYLQCVGIAHAAMKSIGSQSFVTCCESIIALTCVHAFPSENRKKQRSIEMMPNSCFRRGDIWTYVPPPHHHA